jgi:hypothetical protein
MILMRKFFKLIIVALLFFFGYWAIANAFGVQRECVLSELDYIPLLFIILLTIASFALGWKDFRATKKFSELIVGLVGVVLICVVISKLLQYYFIENRETVLSISNKAAADNVLTYDFKRGSSFLLTEYDLLGHDKYIGQYKKEGDTIRILNSNYRGNLHLPQIGVIIKDTMYWSGFDTMILKTKAYKGNFQK